MIVDMLRGNLALVAILAVAGVALFYLWRQLGEARRALVAATKEECTGPLCDAVVKGADEAATDKTGAKADAKGDRKRVRFGADPVGDKYGAASDREAPAAPVEAAPGARGEAVDGPR